MSWVLARLSLIAIEVGWHLLFGLPFLAVCWIEVQRILTVLPLDSTGLTELDPQNPWVAAVKISDAWAHYQPHVAAVLSWLLPVAALVWVVVSGLGLSGSGLRSHRIDIPGPQRLGIVGTDPSAWSE